MEVSNEATSGATADTSGSVENDKQNAAASTSGDVKQDASQSGSTDLVAKIKKEKENYAKRVAELQAQLDAVNMQAKEAKEQELVQKEQYKTLFEQERKEKEAFAKELAQRKQVEVQARKQGAVMDHLFKLGLKPEHKATALRLMDTGTVILDDQTGALIGSEESAKKFYEEFKGLNMFGKTGPGVSQQAPSQDNSNGINTLKSIKTQKEFDAYMKEKYGN